MHIHVGTVASVKVSAHHVKNAKGEKNMSSAIIPCDDGSGNKLRILQANDGDIWISIIDENGHGRRKSVRVCTMQGAGTRKMHIRKQLQNALEEAIRLTIKLRHKEVDNIEN